MGYINVWALLLLNVKWVTPYSLGQKSMTVEYYVAICTEKVMQVPVIPIHEFVNYTKDLKIFY